MYCHRREDSCIFISETLFPAHIIGNDDNVRLSSGGKIKNVIFRRGNRAYLRKYNNDNKLLKIKNIQHGPM